MVLGPVHLIHGAGGRRLQAMLAGQAALASPASTAPTSTPIVCLHGVPYLVATIRPENQPSQRVAEKIGLRLERCVFKNGGDALVFGAAL